MMSRNGPNRAQPVARRRRPHQGAAPTLESFYNKAPGSPTVNGFAHAHAHTKVGSTGNVTADLIRDLKEKEAEVEALKKKEAWMKAALLKAERSGFIYAESEEELASRADANKRGQISVTFSEKKTRRTWFLSGEEEVPWEQWIINAEIRQPSDRERQKFEANLAATLTKSLQTMLVHSSSEKGRSAVPLITNASSISPFPIKMTVKVGGVEVA
ncbi:hypothetical protein NUW54_g8733 [Trametes sanguinea]|uniref:Uncharacterized protein n=1 Tax=Trametes sanguinea TaxID=158606 RepID=A0ACC1PDX2_9APHY|nr:hypothetical protein NUW54_g8733 [Trametes sanguinea]